MNIIEVEVFVYDRRKPNESTYHRVPVNLDHVVFALPNLGDYHQHATSIIHVTTGEKLICRSHLPHELVPRAPKTPDPYY